MTARLAPSLVRLRDEIDRRWPGRDTASDGWIGNAAHQSGVTDLDGDGDADADDAARKSQHNPDSDGIVRAIDVDRNGVDPAAIIDAVRSHPAAWYVIFDRRIYSVTNRWEPRPYAGPDPHTGHLHISILLTTAAAVDARPWFKGADMPLNSDDLLNVRKAVEIELKETIPGLVAAEVRRYATAPPAEDRRDIGDHAPDGSVAMSVPLRLWHKGAEHAYAARLMLAKLMGEIADDPKELAAALVPLLLPAVNDLPTDLVRALATATADEMAKRLAK